MPIRTVPGSDLQYLLICHDADGAERTDDPDGRLSEVAHQQLADTAKPVTDVIFMSHGWLGDVPAAVRQYDSWTGAAQRCEADMARARSLRPGFRPLVIGLHWPSLPWGDEEVGAASFADTGANDVDFYAGVLGDTPRLRAALLEVLSAAADAEPDQLPASVVAAYRTIEAESRLQSAGPKAAPGADRESFDPQVTFGIARELDEEMPSFGGIGSSRVLAPLRMLSFWKMKDRARRFGETGAHQLARSLQQASAGRDVRFHAMGHSFGCVVMSGLLAGPADGEGLQRPFRSATLVQGAVSLWAYCANLPGAGGGAGYFHPIIAKGRVEGPIVTTQSSFDSAVGRAYPLAAGFARQVAFGTPGGGPEFPTYGGIGTFGMQGDGLRLLSQDMQPLSQSYTLQAGAVHNLKSDGFIKGHSDIAKAEVAHAMWSAILS